MSNQQEEYEYRLRIQEAEFERERTATAIAFGMKHIATQIAGYLDDKAYRVVMDGLDKKIHNYLLNAGYVKDSK
jgi:hypothetical protein